MKQLCTPRTNVSLFVHPNGAVYGLKTADGDFKIKVCDYFEHEGSDLGNIRIRYEKL